MSNDTESILAEVVSASLGGAFSASTLYPLEVIKTKMQAETSSGGPASDSCQRCIVRDDSMLGGAEGEDEDNDPPPKCSIVRDDSALGGAEEEDEDNDPPE